MKTFRVPELKKKSRSENFCFVFADECLFQVKNSGFFFEKLMEKSFDKVISWNRQ